MTLEDFPLKIKASATGLVFPDYNLAQSAPVTSYDLHSLAQILMVWTSITIA
jgi:hypothetical protein